jgi:hypothetical protein
MKLGRNDIRVGGNRRLTWWAVGIAMVCGAVAHGVQQLLIPFHASPNSGLLNNQGDLWVYQLGARQIAEGKPLYDPIPPGALFTYPPFAALVFRPLSNIDPGLWWFGPPRSRCG